MLAYESTSLWGARPIEYAKMTTVGRTMVTVRDISIHWMWLALPVAVWFLGALSCICSAWTTHRVHIQTWMNSVLPLAIRPYGKKNGDHESQDRSGAEMGYLVDRTQRGEVGRDIQACYAMTSQWKNMFNERGGHR